jgi:hypothetical protein
MKETASPITIHKESNITFNKHMPSRKSFLAEVHSNTQIMEYSGNDIAVFKIGLKHKICVCGRISFIA